MPLPELSHLDRLRKLRGDAMVTHPGGSLDVIKVERVFSVPRGTPEPEYLSVDAQYPNAKLVEQTTIGGDHQAVEVYRVWHTLPGVALTQRTVDEETRSAVTITSRLVEKPGALSQAIGATVEYQPANDVHGTLITTTVSKPDDRAEYRMMEYTFPALLFGLIPSAAISGRDGTARLQLFSVRRAAFTRLAMARLDIYYGTKEEMEEQLDATALFQPRLNDIVYNGVAFDVAEHNVLNDPLPSGTPPFDLLIQYNSGTENPKWPYFVETFSYPASTPSATEYLASYVDTYRPVSANIRPWRNGWYRLEIVNVRMQ